MPRRSGTNTAPALPSLSLSRRDAVQPSELAATVQIRSAGHFTCPGSRSNPSNRPPVPHERVLHLICCEGGGAEYLGGPRRKTAGVMKPGRALVLWGGSDVGFRLVGSDAYEMVGVTLVTAEADEARKIGAMLLGGVERLIGAGHEPPAPLVAENVAQKMHTHLEAMADEYRQGRIGWQVAMRAHLDLLFTDLIREAAHMDSDAARRVGNLQIVESAQAYFLTNLHVPSITLDDVARTVGISGKRLIARFKEGGMPSPMAYLRTLRLDQARQLVRRGDLRIKDVAARVGMATQNQFSRLYRRHFGVSPRNDRKLYLDNSDSRSA